MVRIYLCVCVCARAVMGLPRCQCIDRACKLWLRGHFLIRTELEEMILCSVIKWLNFLHFFQCLKSYFNKDLNAVELQRHTFCRNAFVHFQQSLKCMFPTYLTMIFLAPLSIFRTHCDPPVKKFAHFWCRCWPLVLLPLPPPPALPACQPACLPPSLCSLY